MNDQLAGRNIVLLGIGHTNAHVVRMWGMQPLADTALTCISDYPVATYSGMLPAVLAGQQSPEDMQIDLVKLCGSVGARLITDQVTTIDTDRRQIHFTERPPVPFDVLSIGLGSVPTVTGVQIEGASLLKIKPMQTFLDRLSTALQQISQRVSDREIRIVVAGSGAAGIEIAFCLPPFIRTHTASDFCLSVVTRSDDILPGAGTSLRSRVRNELSRRQINVNTSSTIVRVSHDGLELNDETRLSSDLVIWATGAAAPSVLADFNLPRDSRGFLATNDTLQSTSLAPVFAVGDTGTIMGTELPKAGVYAVRQGPILWQNIQRMLARRRLISYTPQKSFLKLLNTGDGRAIGEWKGFSFAGRWVMNLKHRIDSRFMAMYRVSSKMSNAMAEMQCRGCGCKLGGEVLESALHAGRTATSEPLDDAAVIDIGEGRIVASTDFFTSPVDDPYLAGRIAALHSASDVVAMGAEVRAALANVVVPEGPPRAQRQGLNDLLAGARREFQAMGADIVGGHTIVGTRWEIGFTVIGQPLSKSLLRKQDLQSGDQLYLTRPLGVGVLLAAHMRHQCHAADYMLLIKTMLQSQRKIAATATQLGLTAGTDITGFGLIGHLVEMLDSSRKSATLDLAQIPLLPGVAEALDAGIESTLAPANRYVECRIHAAPDCRSRPEYKVLFDPQTCGGLLLGVPADRTDEFEQASSAAGVGIAVRIGKVEETVAGSPLIQVS